MPRVAPSLFVLIALLAGLAGCGGESIPVRSADGDRDHNRGELEAAVATFVASNRSLEAFGELAHAVDQLRPGMDADVAALAERQLVYLALEPLESAGALPPAERTAQLGRHLWPFATRVSRLDGESGAAFVRRACAGGLAPVCGSMGAEAQAAMLGNEAVSRLARRARVAVTGCRACETTAWRTALGRWKDHERAAQLARWRMERGGTTAPVAPAQLSVLDTPDPRR